MAIKDILRKFKDTLVVDNSLRIGKINKYKVTRSSNIIKHKDDELMYKYVELSNKMRIFFVNDTSTNISCGHMYVGVGHTCDPDDMSGLAHFLEHMLFKGSRKYPDGAGFMDTVSKNGGDTNAFTAHHRTEYFFTANSDSFIKILDMFSRFFIDPLFDKKYIDTELNAVDSEHQKNIGNDGWRKQSIFEKFFVDKVYNKFSTGTKATLLETVNNDITLLQNKVREFYNTYYSANNMILVVYHNGIDKHNIKNIIDMFVDVPNYNAIIEPKNCIINKFVEKYELITMESIMSNSTLDIAWIVSGNKEYINNLDESPFYLITYIFGHIGKNSLRDILLQQNFVLSHECHIGDPTLGDSSTLNLEFELTDDGYENYTDILCIVSNYIATMVREYGDFTKFVDVYNEMHDIDVMYFESYTKPSPHGVCNNIINRVSTFNIDGKYCQIPSLLVNNAKIIHEKFMSVLRQMNTENMKAVLCSKKNKDFDMVDTHYGTKYKVTLKKIQNGQLNDIKKYDVPKKNPYIPVKMVNLNFDTDSGDIYVRLEAKQHIVAFANTQNVYKSKLCEVITNVDLNNQSKWNVDTYIILRLYVSYIAQINKHKLYDLNVASYNIACMIEMHGMYTLYFSGHTSSTITDIFNEMFGLYFSPNLSIPIDEAMYKVVYTDLLIFFTNIMYYEPYMLLDYEINHSLNPNKTLSYKQIVERLPMFSPESMKNSNNEFNFNNMRKFALDVLCHGNVSSIIGGSINRTICNSFVNNIEQVIKSPTVEHGMNAPLDRYKCGETRKINIRSMNPVSTDDAIMYSIYFGEIDVREKNKFISDEWIFTTICYDFIVIFCQNRFHTNMRTDNKTGYIANVYQTTNEYCKIVDNFISFVVQTNKKNIITLIEEFLTNIANELKNITDDEFGTIMYSIKNENETKFTSIYQEISYIMKNIVRHRCYKQNESDNFNTRDRISEYVRIIDKKSIISKLLEMLKNNFKIILTTSAH